jgi:hypothetical protein
MRTLLFLSALLVVALAIDASAFGGRYKKAFLLEDNYQTQRFVYKLPASHGLTQRSKPLQLRPRRALILNFVSGFSCEQMSLRVSLAADAG